MTRTVKGAAVLAAMALAPVAVLSYPGTPHKLMVQNNLLTFDLDRHHDLAPPNEHDSVVKRGMDLSFFPLLLETSNAPYRGNEPGTDWGFSVDAANWTFTWWNSNSPDQWEIIDWSVFGCPAATPPTMTIRHFWDPDIGGAIGMTAGPLRPPDLRTWSGVPELCPDPLLGAPFGPFLNSDLYPNAWVKGRVHWMLAVTFWTMPTDDPLMRRVLDGWAFTNLGHALHMIGDVGQPAHDSEDMHNGSDSLEEWIAGAGLPDGQKDSRVTSLYSWFPPDYPAAGMPGATDWYTTAGAEPPGRIPAPGDLYYPPPNRTVCDHLATISFTGSTGRYDDPIYMLNDPDLIDDCATGTLNLGELFYLFYVVSQTADYYPSDEYDGNKSEPTGWLGGYAGFPTVNGKMADIQKYGNLTDNDDPPNDDDGDISQILTGLEPWQREMYGLAAGHYGAYQASFMAIRSAIDLFRRTIDGIPPVTTFAAVTREGQPAKTGPDAWNTSPVRVTVTGATDTGRFGRASGVAKVLAQWNGEQREQDGVFELLDGRQVVEGLSYDKTGQVDDTSDLTVNIDTIPPAITFPTMKTVYLTSEWLVPDWIAEDATSGLDSTWGLLDGNPIVQQQPIDLALLAGFHVLRVYAKDIAGNVGWAEFQLEVLIDAQAWPKPAVWNVYSQGEHACVVEFPFPYDTGLIDLATVELQAGAIVTPIHALNIGPVVDDDHDGVGDRAVRFDAGAFGAPLVGFEGNVPAKVTGRLVGDELAPGFVATCTIPVFSPPP